MGLLITPFITMQKHRSALGIEVHPPTHTRTHTYTRTQCIHVHNVHTRTRIHTPKSISLVFMSSVKQRVTTFGSVSQDAFHGKFPEGNEVFLLLLPPKQWYGYTPNNRLLRREPKPQMQVLQKVYFFQYHKGHTRAVLSLDSSAGQTSFKLYTIVAPKDTAKKEEEAQNHLALCSLSLVNRLLKLSAWTCQPRFKSPLCSLSYFLSQ